MKTMAVLMSLKVYLKASSHSLGVLIANKIVCVVFFFFAEEEVSSFEEVEHNDNILTLGLVG